MLGTWIAVWPALAPAAAAHEAAQETAAEAPAPPAEWELSGSVFYSDPPGSPARLTPILYADRGALHLEARYDYEDLDTLSVFAGRTFEAEGEVEVALIPMLGATFGDTRGIAWMAALGEL